MANADIEAVIIRELNSVSNDTVEVNSDTNIVRELNLPSLAVMDLVMALEDHFDISIPLDRIAEIETVQELADLVRSLYTEVEA
jgi:acyl carrier protein